MDATCILFHEKQTAFFLLIIISNQEQEFENEIIILSCHVRSGCLSQWRNCQV